MRVAHWVVGGAIAVLVSCTGFALFGETEWGEGGGCCSWLVVRLL